MAVASQALINAYTDFVNSINADPNSPYNANPTDFYTWLSRVSPGSPILAELQSAGVSPNAPTQPMYNLFSNFTTTSPSLLSQVGQLAGPAAVAAAPFAIGAATGTLGEGGLGAFTGGAGTAASGIPLANAAGAGADAAATAAGMPTFGAATDAASSGGLLSGGIGAAGLGAGAATGAGTGAATGGTTTAASSPAALTAMKNILAGNGTSSDWLALAGAVGPSLLGAYASNQQTDALTSLADKFASYGAPYRASLSDLMANPSSFLSSPEVTTPVQLGTDALARSLSTKGNPAGSGTALQTLQDYSTKSLYDALQSKENQLAGFGGLTQYNAAAPAAATNAVNSQPNVYNAVGSGIANVFNPPTSLADLMKLIKPSVGGNYALA